jgi:SNW domain-containing protein 1
MLPAGHSTTEDWSRPDDETVKSTTDRTREALEKITQGRITANQPKSLVEKAAGPTLIKYVPSNPSATHNSGASSRIIRMVEAPIDPMEPPKFKHQKLPRGPPSPPPPVMHSPPRAITAAEQKEWYIPPSISNWKNRHGYTIPLDKRLASDGRGLQEVTINDNFAKLSEALFIADRHAREEVRLRSEMQGKLAAKEKREKEERLRVLAQKAREERSGFTSGAREPERVGAVSGSNAVRVEPGRTRAVDMDDSGSDRSRSRSRTPPRRRRSSATPPRRARSSSGSRPSSPRRSDDEMDPDQARKLKERDELRRERQKQRERELRLSHMGNETKQKYLSKSSDRDISEKIALGIAQPTRNQETMFDARLFNRSEGLGAGGGGLTGDDDSYNLYDKPLFAGSSASVIYKPPKQSTSHETYGGVDMDGVERMVKSSAPARGFKGAEGGEQRGEGPVQFEKEDVFGLDSFLGAAKRGREGEDGREMGLDAKKRRE